MLQKGAPHLHEVWERRAWRSQLSGQLTGWGDGWQFFFSLSWRLCPTGCVFANCCCSSRRCPCALCCCATVRHPCLLQFSWWCPAFFPLLPWTYHFFPSLMGPAWCVLSSLLSPPGSVRHCNVKASSPLLLTSFRLHARGRSVKCDFLTAAGRALVFDLLKSGRVCYVHMAPPCSTASAKHLWLKPVCSFSSVGVACSSTIC